MASHAELDHQGLLRLPAGMLEKHGIVPGANLVVMETPDGILIQTVNDAILKAQAWSREILAGKENVTVDDFIAERRRSAAAEE